MHRQRACSALGCILPKVSIVLTRDPGLCSPALAVLSIPSSWRPQAMAQRSDGPWIVKGQSTNYGNGNSFGGGNFGTPRGAGDVYDMKGCAM